jgi:hypothetical protein
MGLFARNPAVRGQPWASATIDALAPLAWFAALAPIPWAVAAIAIYKLAADEALALVWAAAFVVFLGSRPSRKALLSTLAMAAAFRALYAWFAGPAGDYFGAALIGWGSFLGFAAFLALVARAVTAGPAIRAPALRDLRAACFFVDSWIVVAFALLLTPRTLPNTLDRFLYAFDRSLGFTPSFAAGAILAGRPLLRGLTELHYRAATAIGMVVIYVWQRRRPVKGQPSILRAMIAMMLAGYALYYLYPAAGPAYAFKALFPRHPPGMLGMPLAPMRLTFAARNCMPSLHMAMALLIWWRSRSSGRVGRTLAAVVLFGTVFATLALGEHYLIDLVVAFPFTIAFQAAMAQAAPLTARVRWEPLATGAAMTFAWIALLRYGVPWMFLSHAIPWVLIIGTVSYSVAVEARLYAALTKAEAPIEEPDEAVMLCEPGGGVAIAEAVRAS